MKGDGSKMPLQARRFCFLSAWLFLFCQSSRAQVFDLASPDKKIAVKISNEDRLSYTVAYHGKTVVAASPMGFEFAGEAPMGNNMQVAAKARNHVDTVWFPVIRSKHRAITDRYEQLSLSLIEKTGQKRRMTVYFRAYDDGVAFRYRLSGNGQIGDRKITRELTGFSLNADAKAWVADYGKYTSPQELEFRPKPLKDVTGEVLAGLPFLIEADKDTYAAITEADIDNYPGFYIGAAKTDTLGSSRSVSLTTRLSPLLGEKDNGIKARFSNDLLTPWRVIMLAGSPGELIESELIQNLNPPCAIKNTNWIKPGMSAWDNWWSGDVKMDMPTIKKFIDMASVQHWPYMLIDWQWYGVFNKPEADIMKPAAQLDMPGLLRYARSKKVRCWLWLHSSDVNRNDVYQKAFPLYQKWGIAGVKIDFMERDDQEMVNWYRRIIAAAAKNHLLVDFHGAYKPDGIIRTYPNMITREGVLGEEYAKFSDRITSEHNTTLPFTRMLAGQMDYTPGGFLNVSKDHFRKGIPTEVMNSRCAELAKFVVFESPFTVYCDAPEHLLGQPGADFLKGIPTTWDETKVLAGYPGEYIVTAKENGNTWYLGAMTNSQPRTLQIKADFLPPGNYQLSAWSDVIGSPQELHKNISLIRSASTINIPMDGSGGWVGEIRKLK